MNSKARFSLVACLAVGGAVGCGTRSQILERDPTGGVLPPEMVDPIGLYVEADDICAQEVSVDLAEETLTPGSPSDNLAVTEVAFVEECTDAGGQYVIARELDGFREFWLGAHACYFWSSTPPTGIVFGVVKYRQTAGLNNVAPETCIGFPDEPAGLSTDAQTQAIAVFETLEGAQAFYETVAQ
ncbi:MAG: hypothetical protein IPK82_31015 [Polyangiaceae bacterium]|nr:hypothetical protein [Polyangiaceae bacterium]